MSSVLEIEKLKKKINVMIEYVKIGKYISCCMENFLSIEN